MIAHVRSKYEKLDVEPEQGLFNHKCFNNAVEYAFNGTDVGVVEVICVMDDRPVLHYINVRDGTYLETTLGYKAAIVEYYYIREIDNTYWLKIEHIFNQSLEEWTSAFMSNFWRTMLSINRIL